MLTGREEEYKKLEILIKDSLANSKKTLSLYISGPPGTGKSATVGILFERLKSPRTKFISINCISYSSINSIMRNILEALNKNEKIPARCVKAEFEKSLKNGKKKIVVLLDEIDKTSNTSSVLSTLFSWPYQFLGKLILIGISNSFNIIEKILPKMKSIKIETITFAPYTSQQLIAILKGYLEKESPHSDTKAIELCARKVASLCGDVRMALGIAKEHLSEDFDYYDDNLKENDDPKADGNDNSAFLPATPPRRIPLNSCMGVLNSLKKVYASPCRRYMLPQHPKILLASLMKLLNELSNNNNHDSVNKNFGWSPHSFSLSKISSVDPVLSVSRDQLSEAYFLICQQMGIQPLEGDELDSALELLCSQSMVSVRQQPISIATNSRRLLGKVGGVAGLANSYDDPRSLHKKRAFRNQIAGAGNPRLRAAGSERVHFLVEMAIARAAINDQQIFNAIDSVKLISPALT